MCEGKMDRMQIALKLGLDILGIPVCVGNYRKICDAAYLAEQKGVHISPARVLFDAEEGHAYSPRSHETSNFSSRSLVDDVCEIERELSGGFDESIGWKLDDVSTERLKALKNKLPKV